MEAVSFMPPQIYNQEKNPANHLFNSLSGWFWGRKNLFPMPVFKPRTIQPVMSYYTNCTIR
jgi:hypothetical protein